MSDNPITPAPENCQKDVCEEEPDLGPLGLTRGASKSWTADDIPNLQVVGAKADHIVVMAPQLVMTKKEALMHAAFLVALADDNDEFDAILTAVKST